MSESKQKLNILVLAYTVSPIRGSEYSVGWNYIREMSLAHNLFVLYGCAGQHMGNIDEVIFNDECAIKNVTWIPILPNFLAKLLNFPNRRGYFIYSFYAAYNIWHRQVYRVAKNIVEDRRIDLIHYLCPIGYREPGYLWKIDKP